MDVQKGPQGKIYCRVHECMGDAVRSLGSNDGPA